MHSNFDEENESTRYQKRLKEFKKKIEKNQLKLAIIKFQFQIIKSWKKISLISLKVKN